MSPSPDQLLHAQGERRARQHLEALGAVAALRYLAQVRREQHAHELLRQGVPRSVAHQRLAQVHGIGRRSAERLTSKVLAGPKLRQ